MWLRLPDPLLEILRPIHFRGKARLLNSVAPNSGLKTARVFGTTFHLDLADFIQRQIYLGTAEPQETRLVKQYLKPGMTFVDVGANVGYYTALAAKLVGPAGRVIAFEPSPYAFERLSAMVSANRLRQVTVINAGLSDKAGRLNIYVGIGSHNHAPTMVAHENASVHEVNVLTLDEEMDRLGIKRIDLMKVDVEGYEPKVLRGATRLLETMSISAILCEFNKAWLIKAGSSVKALEEIIDNAGFNERGRKDSNSALENRFFEIPQFDSHANRQR